MCERGVQVDTGMEWKRARPRNQSPLASWLGRCATAWQCKAVIGSRRNSLRPEKLS